MKQKHKIQVWFYDNKSPAISLGFFDRLSLRRLPEAFFTCYSGFSPHTVCPVIISDHRVR